MGYLNAINLINIEGNNTIIKNSLLKNFKNYMIKKKYNITINNTLIINHR